MAASAGTGTLCGVLCPRPLIAVTTSEIRPGEPSAATLHADPSQHEMVLGIKYLKAIEMAGGIPVVVAPSRPDTMEALLDRASGVCLSGGPDLDPVAYGQRRHERLGPTWRELDDFELALAQAADARGLPILAICRGMQVLNISRGGTLHQHVPDVVGTSIAHRQSQPGSRPTHRVDVRARSLLARIVGAPYTEVNSFHHQAVDALGDGLTVTSRAPDGTVESVEARDQRFVVGVQWHAECLVADERQAALFAAFTTAARGYESGDHRMARAA
jgi:putative glutamine amidotransferase